MFISLQTFGFYIKLYKLLVRRCTSGSNEPNPTAMPSLLTSLAASFQIKPKPTKVLETFIQSKVF